MSGDRNDGTVCASYCDAFLQDVQIRCKACCLWDYVCIISSRVSRR
jgi:hypothetical protein